MPSLVTFVMVGAILCVVSFPFFHKYYIKLKKGELNASIFELFAIITFPLYIIFIIIAILIASFL